MHGHCVHYGLYIRRSQVLGRCLRRGGTLEFKPDSLCEYPGSVNHEAQLTVPVLESFPGGKARLSYRCLERVNEDMTKQ